MARLFHAKSFQVRQVDNSTKFSQWAILSLSIAIHSSHPKGKHIFDFLCIKIGKQNACLLSICNFVWRLNETRFGSKHFIFYHLFETKWMLCFRLWHKLKKNLNIFKKCLFDFFPTFAICGKVYVLRVQDHLFDFNAVSMLAYTRSAHSSVFIWNKCKCLKRSVFRKGKAYTQESTHTHHTID